jgi:hypothetical protein
MSETREAPVFEADVTVSMLRRVNLILERADLLINQDPRDVAKLTDSERAQRDHEIEQATSRAAELIAKYRIDRAMLASSGKLSDGTVDRAVMASRPFAEQMNNLFYVIATNAGAKTTWIKSWNPMSGPKARGGTPKGGYDYGYRVFAYESDFLGMEVMFAHLVNQARAGVAQIKDENTKFGQRQKAMRESWLNGFVAGVRRQLDIAKIAAQERAEAEDQEAKDRAMESPNLDLLAGSGPSVALVLADRAKALTLAYDASRGITPADRARWAEDHDKFAKQYRQEQEEREALIDACTKCKKAKRGRCNDHVIRVGRRSYSYSSRIGDDMGLYNEGHAAGMAADLGSGTSVATPSRMAI